VSWPDRRLIDLFGIRIPLVQAPMAGASSEAMALAVAAAGGLGSLPCGMLDAEGVAAAMGRLDAACNQPINLNFFCHGPSSPEDAAWRARLAPYYRELGVAAEPGPAGGGRAPFDPSMCEVLEALRPRVVSFHFGLPQPDLLARVQACGTVVIGCATTVAEARWLEGRGCDAIIAQGAEAGGHRGNFLDTTIDTQCGTCALVPQIVDAVRVPVIAAGGIADGRGIAAAFALGAAGVQIGTADLRTTEARIAPAYRDALRTADDSATTLTNVFTGRAARGIVNRLIREQGPFSTDAPAYPHAATALAPLRAAAEADGSGDFSPMWAGQAAKLGRACGAGELTDALARDALAVFGALGGR
jgi:nitronate monooxygenase